MVSGLMLSGSVIDDRMLVGLVVAGLNDEAYDRPVEECLDMRPDTTTVI
jgi:hypothetical protein